jgi:uncharacterized membrane protein
MVNTEEQTMDEQRLATLERRLDRVEEAVGLAVAEAPERPRRVESAARAAESAPRAEAPRRAEAARRAEAPRREEAARRAAEPAAWAESARRAESSTWLAGAAEPMRPRLADVPQAPPAEMTRRGRVVDLEEWVLPAARREESAWALPDLEQLLGGRLLALAGGMALLVGFAFFLAIAISHGWLGETARCVIAAVGAFGVIGAGVRLKAPVAALTAIGAGIAALDVDVTVAAQTYNLISTPLALALVLAIGTAATAFALTRDSQVLAAFGIVGGLLAPALAGAGYDGATIALLLAATVPAATVLLAKRWDRIAVAAFGVTVVQLTLWLGATPDVAPALLALGAFGALWVVQAIGFELRTASPTLRPVSAGLLTVNALYVAALGALVLTDHHQTTVLDAWLGGLALVHLAVGLAAHRSGTGRLLRHSRGLAAHRSGTGRLLRRGRATTAPPRVSPELGLLALTLGVLLGDVALATTLDGLALPLAYATSALVFAALSRLKPVRTADQALVGAGLGGHVLLAAGNALALDATASGAFALAAVAATSFAAARVSAFPRPYRGALDAVALGALAYLAARTLNPVPLTLAWAAEAVALAQVWRRSRDGVAAGAAWLHLLGATGVALAVVAPPLALADGLQDALGAAVVLAAVAAAWFRIGRAELTTEDLNMPNAINYAVAAALALYLASAEVVTPLPFHTGQVALSALWAISGIATLVGGLVTDRAPLRRAGLLLLVVSVGKVFIFDLENLDSAARAGSFLALGTVLLAAAAAWHRYAPRELAGR